MNPAPYGALLLVNVLVNAGVNVLLGGWCVAIGAWLLVLGS
jgi:hypothetical protein